MRILTALPALVLLAAACGGGASSSPQAPGSTRPAPSTAPSGSSPKPASGLSVPAGFSIQVIGNVGGARELAAAPNGNLFVGTTGSNVYVIANAEGQAASPSVFTQLPDSPAAGVALALSGSSGTMYVGTEFGVYRIPYSSGDRKARSAPVKIASIRAGGGSGHNTTSVAFANGVLYASVGSSCNACTESDPTRATVQQMHADGSAMTAKAVRIRNAIALAVNPATQTVWAGNAGQDSLANGHPYELFDAVTRHAGVADYGWPECEENRQAYTPGANCSSTVIPRVVFPAYETLIGAAFYPLNASGPYAFPAAYRGGAFVATHGSWHTGSNGTYLAPPRVAFVPMNGDTPRTPVKWSDPTAQWSNFVSGFQLPDGRTRIGRPTGVAVGASGSLFVADDQTGNIYRIRP